eukprot:COSAG01_NODE_16588_length_1223_cov_1.444840_2_plen_164_part_00
MQPEPPRDRQVEYIPAAYQRACPCLSEAVAGPASECARLLCLRCTAGDSRCRATWDPFVPPGLDHTACRLGRRYRSPKYARYAGGSCARPSTQWLCHDRGACMDGWLGAAGRESMALQDCMPPLPRPRRRSLPRAVSLVCLGCLADGMPAPVRWGHPTREVFS